MSADPTPDGRPVDRSLTWWPIIGAAVIAVIALVVVLILGSGHESRNGLQTDANGALLCPTSYDFSPVTGVRSAPRAWVPAQAQGVDGDDSLVIDSAPQHVTVCRYDAKGAAGDRAASFSLDGSKVLTSGTKAMTKALSAVPRTSHAVQGDCGDPGTFYLAGFVFAAGAEWVTVPDTGCQLITNGVFDTTAGVGAQIETSFTTGSWN